ELSTAIRIVEFDSDSTEQRLRLGRRRPVGGGGDREATLRIAPADESTWRRGRLRDRRDSRKRRRRSSRDRRASSHGGHADRAWWLVRCFGRRERLQAADRLVEGLLDVLSIVWIVGLGCVEVDQRSLQLTSVEMAAAR